MEDSAVVEAQRVAGLEPEGENVGRVVVYQADHNMSFARPGWLALVTLLAYTTVAVVAAVALFSRRDVLTV